MGKFVVKLKRRSSSYETDQGEKPRKVLFTGVRTVGLPDHRLKEQPQASGATGSDDVSANPPSMCKVNDIGNLWDVL